MTDPSKPASTQGNGPDLAMPIPSPPPGSISALLSRLTDPRILAHSLPSYRHSFSLPDQRARRSTDEPERVETGSSVPAGIAATPRHPGPRYVEWNSLVTKPAGLLSSFHAFFRGQASSAYPGPASSSPPPRLVFFGEQHHQPEVLRAQLQTLSALHARCSEASGSSRDHPASSSKHLGEPPPLYRLHLVLEHFSVEDQPMLSSFSAGKLSTQGLMDSYAASSEEGFQLSHYMPLLLLARELDVPIWGGFPPRRWARDVFREGIEAVQRNEQSWLASTAKASSPSPLWAPARLSKLPNWSMVTNLHAAHRSYLSSLMRPDQPPRFPLLPSGSASEPLISLMSSLSGSQIYPTWLLRTTASESKGFAPAQALKDSYFAHVTAWVLRGAGADTGSSTAAESRPRPAEGRSEPPRRTGEEGRRVVNVSLCIAGLGHVEYGHGAPERVIHLLRHPHQPFFAPDSARDSTPACPRTEAELARIEPLIIASKPADSGVWLGFEAPSVLDPSEVASTGTEEGGGGKGELGGGWKTDPWERKLADAVVLYEWREDEGEEGEEERG